MHVRREAGKERERGWREKEKEREGKNKQGTANFDFREQGDLNFQYSRMEWNDQWIFYFDK